MTVEGDQTPTHPMLRLSEPMTRGELVWTHEGTAEQNMPALPAVAESVGARDAVTDDDTQPSTEEVALSAIDRLRLEALDRLNAEITERRAELERTLERERASAQERIATAERLQQEALARRQVVMDRWNDDWGTSQHQELAKRIDAALTEQLREVRMNYRRAEARMMKQVEARRREELDRIEMLRKSERERLEAELAAEEQRFNERLMEQLNAFEFQLAERYREQEERIAQWWRDAGEAAKTRVATLLNDAISSVE